ncbi:uncharacterized protein LOC111593774 [Drosophila hydei]|uniref:Uncharacterized protein LOC111593774 n=1 Tax=Drosophila hydei TaxID=7224 RepID=A0A6J1LGV3_DROHY|nr:uncharacterized protein LOC111593774 [Drosophila hydei]
MWMKCILALVVAALVGQQIAAVEGLSCYTCNSPSSCRYPSSQYCNVQTANATSSWLSAIHSNVPSIVTYDYKCVNLTYFYASNNVKAQEILGCYYSAIPVCNLNLNATNAYSWAKSCRTCNYNNCNHNPAGTFSKSSFTIMASALLLILVKVFV